MIDTGFLATVALNCYDGSMVKEIPKRHRTPSQVQQTPFKEVAKKPVVVDSFVKKENVPDLLNVRAQRRMEPRPEARLVDPELVRSATTIQAAMRGLEVRKKTVFAGEIANYLRDNLKGFETSGARDLDIDAMSKAISREILKFAQDPNSIPAGNGKRLFQAGETYSFPRFDKDGTHLGSDEVSLPVGLWIRRTPDKKGLELEMIGKELGMGANKTVYQSRPLRIDFATPGHKMAIDRSVLVRAEPDQAEQVLAGLRAVEQFFSPQELSAARTAEGKEIRFAGLLTHTNRLDATGVLEARDVEYTGDLDRQAEMSPEQHFQVLADVAATLEVLHGRGGVHGDIKGGNIMVDGASPRGFVSDFDGVSKLGDSGKSGGSTGPFMDAIAKEKGMLTPFTDIYGLAKTASKSLFGTFVDDATSFEEKANERIDRLVGYYEFGEEKKRALLRMRDAIAGVLSENKETVEFLDDSEGILADLSSDDAAIRNKGMAKLTQQFPAFADFLESFQEAQKAFGK